MPIYCFICERGHREEDFFWPTEDVGKRLCSECGGLLRRDYKSEHPLVLSDIEPYFDFSIGEYIKGRRDKATKYRAGGYRMMYGWHGGDIAVPYKQYYEDERQHISHERYIKTDEEKRFEDMVAKGLGKVEVESDEPSEGDT